MWSNAATQLRPSGLATSRAIAATRGNQEQQRRGGADLGAMAEPVAEEALAPETAEAAAEAERQIDA